MASELKPLEIEDRSELHRLVDEVRRAGQPRHLQRNGRDVALLVPVDESASTRKPSSRKGRRTDAGDPLWNVIGIGESTGPSDVSSNKHKYLAAAYSSDME